MRWRFLFIWALVVSTEIYGFIPHVMYYRIRFSEKNKNFLGVVVCPDYACVPKVEGLDEDDIEYDIIKLNNQIPAMNMIEGYADFVWADAERNGYLAGKGESYYREYLERMKRGDWSLAFIAEWPWEGDDGPPAENWDAKSFRLSTSQIIHGMAFSPGWSITQPFSEYFFKQDAGDYRIPENVANGMAEDDRLILGEAVPPIYFFDPSGKIHFAPLETKYLTNKLMIRRGAAEAKFQAKNPEVRGNYLPLLFTLIRKHQLFYLSHESFMHPDDDNFKLWLGDGNEAVHQVDRFLQQWNESRKFRREMEEGQIAHLRMLGEQLEDPRQVAYLEKVEAYLRNQNWQRQLFHNAVYIHLSGIRPESGRTAIHQYFEKVYGLPPTQQTFPEEWYGGTPGINTTIVKVSMSWFESSLRAAEQGRRTRYPVDEASFTPLGKLKNGKPDVDCVTLLTHYEADGLMFGGFHQSLVAQ